MVFEHDYKNYPELTNSELQTMRFSSPHEQIDSDFEAVVIKVHDGDTVTLRAEFRDFDFPLRFLNIDAPELSEGGNKTRDWLKNKIEGQTVQVLIDPTRRVGKYGRLLGRIIYNGLDVGQEEIYLGLASVFGQKKEGEVSDVNKHFNIKQWL